MTFGPARQSQVVDNQILMKVLYLSENKNLSSENIVLQLSYKK